MSGIEGHLGDADILWIAGGFLAVDRGRQMQREHT
jgi:hypothetical protein